MELKNEFEKRYRGEE
jgi:hypothetical protein